MLNMRITSLLVAAWADGACACARELMLCLAAEAACARTAGNDIEAGGCERAREQLCALWATVTHDLIDSRSGHPEWDGLADRLWDPEPVAHMDDENY